MALLARSTLTKLHLLLATFMFPVAFMFLLTGGLYTWDVKGSYDSHIYPVDLTQPLAADEQQLVELVRRELQRLDIGLPSGGAGIKKAGTSFQLEWTGSSHDVLLEPTEAPLVARLTVKQTSWYRHFVQLHKAKGSVLFKVYAACLAVSLFTILLTGFLLAWQVPKFRSLALGCGLAGVMTFAVFAALA